jgi:hypothetical protein
VGDSDQENDSGEDHIPEGQNESEISEKEKCQGKTEAEQKKI